MMDKEMVYGELGKSNPDRSLTSVLVGVFGEVQVVTSPAQTMGSAMYTVLNGFSTSRIYYTLQ